MTISLWLNSLIRWREAAASSWEDRRTAASAITLLISIWLVGGAGRVLLIDEPIGGEKCRFFAGLPRHSKLVRTLNHKLHKAEVDVEEEAEEGDIGSLQL